jgi:hypothetical protein
MGLCPARCPEPVRPAIISLYLSQKGTPEMDVTIIPPLAALIAGIVILVQPKFLNYIVAFYLIIVGAIGLMGV